MNNLLYSSIPAALGNLYNAIYSINLMENTFEILKTLDFFRRSTERIISVSKLIDVFIDGLVEKDRAKARALLNLQTLSVRLKGQSFLTESLQSLRAGWIKAYLIPSGFDEYGMVTSFLFCTQDNNREVERELEYSHELENQLHIVSALSSDYLNVYVLHPREKIVEIVKLDGYVPRGMESGKASVYPYDTAVHNYIEARVLPEDRESLYEAMRVEKILQVLQTQKTYDRTYRVVEADESVHYYQFRFRKIAGTDRIICGFKNIDELVAESRQKELLEERYRSIHRMMKSGMWRLFYDEQGQLEHVEWSDEFRRMLGYTDVIDFPDRMDSWLRLLHQEDHRAYDMIGQTVADLTGSITYDEEYRLNTRDRGWRWFRATGEVIRREDGTPFCFYGVFLDINDQKEHDALEAQRDKALQRANEALDAMSAIHEALGSGSWSFSFDEQGRVAHMEWSKEARALMGYYTEEDGFPAPDNIFEKLVHPQDIKVMFDAFNTALNDKSGALYDAKFRILTKHGGYHWFHSAGSFRRRPDGSPEVLYGILMDIDEKQRAHDSLRDALAAAEHANKAKTTFLNSMSHDIRTPMNAIIGFTALAASHISHPEALQEYLRKISTSSKHLLNLINDVLDMSRIESGKVTIEEAPVHLPDLLHDLRTIVQANITAKQQEFFIDVQDVETEDIVTDRLRLSQVLLNIMSNAIKFTPSRGTITMRVSEQPTRGSEYTEFCFTIRDTGIGISPEYLGHIFEPFSREQSSTVSGIQGTGLGMAITKNIVDMMGGALGVTSEVGRGTEFTLCFRFRKSGTPATLILPPELDGMHALVADDDLNSCTSITRMLTTIGMRAEWTTLGREAVFRAKFAIEQGDEFQAYVIDWAMPDMNGLEVVRRIREVIGDSKPIIIITAYDWAEIEEEARRAGVTAFCSKPIFLSELREALCRPFRNADTQTVEFGLTKDPSLQGHHVLLVEDNELNQEIARAILEEEGLEVDVVSDGIYAVERLSDVPAGTYDLVLMDIQMPLMDGYEATRQIRAMSNPAKACIPIEAMTANAFDEDKKMAREAGMNAHLSKPIELAKLRQTLSDIINHAI